MKSKIVSINDVLKHPKLSLKAGDYVVQMVIDTELTLEEISNIMVTAFEGGINYWCGEVIIIDPPPFPFDFASDVIGLGGRLKLVDLEDEDQFWILDMPKLRNGIGKFCEIYEKPVTWIIDNMDADIADAVIQYGLFNEIVYG
jgi:hypothetical protein